MTTDDSSNTITLRGGTKVRLEACDVVHTATAFDQQGTQVGHAQFQVLDEDDERFLVTNIEVAEGYGRIGLATALIKEFADELGAIIYFEPNQGSALISGAHLTGDGLALADYLVRNKLAHWRFPD
ncbi:MULTISPECIES: hypothetical protein [Bacteria]|nr:hypothetical protein [Stenotrophomonas maltophilia]MBH1475930.1 hypothetical protein [Stenotrophomonas maltophilia]MBH1501566.1 hypothetical protein [Stenotrophomonas maltophilia]MBH1784673.1 hypothetical protein [Stenotrophomonas maltophilia]